MSPSTILLAAMIGLIALTFVVSRFVSPTIALLIVVVWLGVAIGWMLHRHNLDGQGILAALLFGVFLFMAVGAGADGRAGDEPANRTDDIQTR